MKITVVGVGKLKERYWVEGTKEYIKRINKYWKLEVIELADEKAPETLSLAQEEQLKEKEGQRILKVIKKDAFVITLEILGNALTSEGLAELISRRGVEGTSHVVFVIGGSLGLSSEVIQRSNYHLSFSSMTFPHQMMRIILLEQLYRAIKISKNEPYHK